MMAKIIDAKHINGFIIHILFSDGIEGDIDLEGELTGEVFRPLSDPSYFKQFTLHPELHTISWPNGADFAPEFLYDRVQIPV